MPQPNRLAALDVFRGITVAAMLLVNNPGTWSAMYWPLAHAEWHGWTPTDLVFPFFLFIVGITTALSKKEPAQILKRGGLIILFGLLLNAFPFFWWGKIAGVDDPTFLQRVAYRFEHWRFTGVLQRIGLVYIFAALIGRYCSRRAMIAIVVALLGGYWALLSLGPLAPPEATIAAAIDRAVLGPNHIWSGGGKLWDPEGVLSTIPAIATALLGLLAAGWVIARRLRALTFAGIVAIAIGLAWDLVFPINKNLWTSSYVVFTAGCACVLLAFCIWLIDVRGIRWWSQPFLAFGVNPLVAFLGTGLMARTIISLIKVDVDGKRISLQAGSYQLFYAPYFEPKLASLLWALSFLLLWLVILEILRRRRIILRV